MDASLPVVVFFVANIVYCLAYIVTDMVWLRVLTIVAALLTFPYFIFASQVMYSALFWQSAFAIINVLNLILIFILRRPVPLGEEETMVKNMVFRHFTSREASTLFKAASWTSACEGDSLMQQGESLDRLYLLYAGKIRIIQNGVVVAYRGPGSFIGEIGYMTDSAASAEVIIDENSCLLEWKVDDLKLLLKRRHGLRQAFESLLAVNVANKLGSFQQLRAA